jgi:hypothetical protein
MGQILHGSATTTEAIRRAIQNSQESLRSLSKRYGINQKTVAKWRKRTSVADLPTGPKERRPTGSRFEGIERGLVGAQKPNAPSKPYGRLSARLLCCSNLDECANYFAACGYDP